VARAGHLALFGGSRDLSRLDDFRGLLLAKTADLIDRLLVYPERMKKNLESTGGLISAAQLLLDLAEAGMLREEAYSLVQSHAMRAGKKIWSFATKCKRRGQSLRCSARKAF